MATEIWDWDIGLGCSECGASLWEDDDRAFSFAPRSYLCQHCAKERGGVYDLGQAAWITPPDVRGVGLPKSSPRPSSDCAMTGRSG